jgi:uncharacterized protein (DUF697 family)
MLHKIIKGYNTAAQVSNILHTFSNMNQELKAQQAHTIIVNHVGFAASAGLIPIPGADLAAVTAVQLNMLRQLAKHYDVKFMDNLGKNIITAVLGSSIARLGASLVKAIPGVGTLIGEMGMAAMSAASTYGLGKMFARHFENGGTLENFDLKASKQVYAEELKNSKTAMQDIPVKEEPTMDIVQKLKQLAELKTAGVLSEEEFQLMKGKLIAQY